MQANCRISLGRLAAQQVPDLYQSKNQRKYSVRCDRLTMVAIAAAAALGFLGDLHRLDPDALRWVDLTSSTHGSAPQPSKGNGFTAVAESLFLFGGFAAGGAGNELPFIVRFLQFTDHPRPLLRLVAFVHAAAVCFQNEAFMSSFAGYIGDFHFLDTTTMIWTDLSSETAVAATAGSALGPRASHGVEAIGGIVYVFGGWSMTGK